MENYNRQDAEILELAKTRILTEYRFLSHSMEKIVCQEKQDTSFFQTDGEKFYYNSKLLKSYFEQNTAQIARMLLHMLLHCLMGHPFKDSIQDMPIWNLASDLAVEGVILGLIGSEWKLEKDDKRKQQYLRLEDYAKGSSAEALYNYLIDSNTGHDKIQQLQQLFQMDEHSLWHIEKSQKTYSYGKHSQKQQMGTMDEEDDVIQDEIYVQEKRQNDSKEHRKKQEQKAFWKKIANVIKTDLDTFHQRMGAKAGGLMSALNKFTKEKIDYSQFLQRFVSPEETMKISEDEFDLVYYSYGIEKYGNIPLIEPLEYKEENRIQELAIAIDTSGSVQGDIVNQFLSHTFYLLKQEGYFSSKVKIQLIQCDCVMQSHVEITSIEEVDDVMTDFEIKGFGGTDFRPVFTYLEEMQEKKKIEKLAGLIYFTDGVGIYPEERPDYPTTFIFHREECLAENIPDWIETVIVEQDQIHIVSGR